MPAPSTAGVESFDSISGIENVETFGGNDRVTGSMTANKIATGNGNDTVNALSGDDTVDAGAGADLVNGSDGLDSLLGSFGNDTVNGGDDNDIISGGSGADELRGGAGADLMSGGSFGDTFVYEDGDIGYDTVNDFDVNADTILFGEGFLHENGFGNVVLSDVLQAWNAGGGNSALAAYTESDGWQFIALLRDVTQAELNAEIASGDAFEVEGQITDVELLL